MSALRATEVVEFRLFTDDERDNGDCVVLRFRVVIRIASIGLSWPSGVSGFELRVRRAIMDHLFFYHGTATVQTGFQK